ncbi:MAG: acyl-CoA carboxylase subunit beta [Myxococcales bacterium]|nr:MAG: acyl-CoA carboxylase subunit beta [Myxococcales bacterium]
MTTDSKLKQLIKTVQVGGKDKYHEQNKQKGKLFARKRIEMLVDENSFIEDATLANHVEKDLPADGVVTGFAKIDARTVAIVANDSTVKAGSWGKRTVEKKLRLQQGAATLRCPVFYLVDSAGARITDQLHMFPGRRGAGHIFYNQVQFSGVMPQICLLFGPSAAGGAYIPAFCDVVFMVEGNASMYLGSPRMAEMVIGEKVSLEQMGGARMHCSTSGCGDILVQDEEQALKMAKRYLGYMPQNCETLPPRVSSKKATRVGSLESVIPKDENKAFDMMQVIEAIIDEHSFFEIKELYAQEIVTGFARLDGHAIGVVANQPKHLGGVLFPNSANKAARFIQLCDAFNVPLLYLADVPGFMIGSAVEQQGIIRAGAKMVCAVSEATVPCISVIVRKAYGAGLYAMCGPAFEPDCCLALTSASIAVMGPRAAVNAVFYKKIQELPDGKERESFVNTEQDRYRQDVDLLKLASELVVDAVIPSDTLRSELIARFDLYRQKIHGSKRKKHAVYPM